MNLIVEQFLISILHHIEANGRPIPHNIFQRALSKTVKKLLPSPFQSAWMEWEYGTWIGAFANYDEGGRQLGEANVLPQWLATPLDDKWRPFKGPGIRHGHPFNVDAFHEMSQCWDNLLLDAASLRKMYCRRHQHNNPILSAKDLFIITSITVSVPSFLMRRQDVPTPDGSLPRQAAAAFKVIGGMYAATNQMMSQAHPMLTQAELNIDDFLTYIEAEGLLLSPESRACAAPVKMIRQILSAVILPATDPVSDPTSDQGLSYYGDDAERVFDYGILCVRIDLGVLLHWRSLRHYLRALLQHPNTSKKTRDFLLEEPELGINDNTPLQNYGKIAEQLLSFFDSSTITPEKELMAKLPLTEMETTAQDDIPVSIESIGHHCYQLELAMRSFVRQHQSRLDQLLQRPALSLPKEAWSPAPGSRFLKKLLKIDPRLGLATSFK